MGDSSPSNRYKKLTCGQFLKIQIFICLMWAVALSGCDTVHYYGQAISGQLKILANRNPIDRLLIEPETPQPLKTRLRLVLEIRAFAKDALHLPTGNHYLSYTDLNRPYVVWNVFAAPEFSLESKTWYYPIIGRAAYRGYFSKQTALTYADKLHHKGFDVYVAGVAAYSTLGWFDDSILNTVIHRTETGLAALIFHELAHQVLYIKDDTAFNESFATAVEQEGLRRWMTAANTPQAYQAYLRQRRRRHEFVALVMKYRLQLESLYRQSLSYDDKRKAKITMFNQMRIEYDRLKSNWQGYTGFDYWYDEPLNNAKLLSVSTYHDYVPAFIRILEQNEGDLVKFYGACKSLSKLPKTERSFRLQKIWGNP